MSDTTYTCKEYRLEMILLGLRRQLTDPNLDDAERERLKLEIIRIEKEMGME